MKIILVGGGKVGTALARQLSEEDHNVTVIDTNKARTFTQKRPVCSAGPARYANGFPFGGAGYTADGEGYPLKMGALRAGNA